MLARLFCGLFILLLRQLPLVLYVSLARLDQRVGLRVVEDFFEVLKSVHLDIQKYFREHIRDLALECCPDGRFELLVRNPALGFLFLLFFVALALTAHVHHLLVHFLFLLPDQLLHLIDIDQ